MIKYCCESGKDWDEGLPYVLFALRDTKQESLGFSPAELVFGHDVHSLLKVLREQLVCSSSPKMDVPSFVSRCRERLKCAVKYTKDSLACSQGHEN